MDGTLGQGNDGDVNALAALLGRTAPFDGLPAAVQQQMSRTARIRSFAPGEVILDAFTDPGVDVHVVMTGSVDLWNTLPVRLRYQLEQYQRSEPPTDLLVRDRLSPNDRSMLAQAVHEIAAVQRRMDNVAVYLPADAWYRQAEN